jgi:hypothetical protein
MMITETGGACVRQQDAVDEKWRDFKNVGHRFG